MTDSGDVGKAPAWADRENDLTEYKKQLSINIRNALARLELQTFLGEKQDAHDEIQELSRFLYRLGL